MRLRFAFLVTTTALLVLTGVVVRAQGPPRAAPVVHRIDFLVAVVGSTPIFASEVEVALDEWQQRGRALPADPNAAKLEVLNELINIEVLLQKAREFNITVTDAEITGEVEQYIRQLRERNFGGDDAAFRAALQASDFRTLEGFRARQMEVQRKQRLQQLVIDSLRAKGRFPTVHVSERELREAFEEYRKQQPNMGAGVTFRQIVLRVQASESEQIRARRLADSLLVALRAGASFDSVARAFSDDSTTAARGGDLGSFRRGAMDPEFDKAVFSLAPGRLSQVVHTRYGYHIIRVDRVRASEVSARHILIRERRDSVDVARTIEQATRIGEALAGGASYDSLAALYHDPAEDRVIADPYPIDSLPAPYRAKLSALGPNQVAAPIELPDQRGDPHQVAVVQLLTRTESSAPTFERVRERLLERTREARSMERLIATLRREVYVVIHMDRLARIGQ